MIDTIWQGIFIGMLVSAPMGPIGVLCVQRTLNEGRYHGLITGLGAMLSDLVYALIAGLGLGFIASFIETNQNPIQLLGSIILLVVGFFVSRSNPTTKLQKQKDKDAPYWKDFLSAFFLNLSNVGIFFYFIAMFARFNFITVDNTQNIVGMATIALGIMLWWFIVSTVVDKLRNRFNLRALKLFNRILGFILVLIGVIGSISAVYRMGLMNV